MGLATVIDKWIAATAAKPAKYTHEQMRILTDIRRGQFFTLFLIGGTVCKFIFGYKWPYIIFAAFAGPLAYHILDIIFTITIWTTTMLWLYRRAIICLLMLFAYWLIFCMFLEYIRCDLQVEWLTDILKGWPGMLDHNRPDEYYIFRLKHAIFFAWAVPALLASVLYGAIKDFFKKMGRDTAIALAGAAAGGAVGYYVAKKASKHASR